MCRAENASRPRAASLGEQCWSPIILGVNFPTNTAPDEKLTQTRTHHGRVRGRGNLLVPMWKPAASLPFLGCCLHSSLCSYCCPCNLIPSMRQFYIETRSKAISNPLFLIPATLNFHRILFIKVLPLKMGQLDPARDLQSTACSAWYQCTGWMKSNSCYF